MKANTKRGSAVLDAPGEMYAPEAPWGRASYSVPEPAPAGALQRTNPGTYSAIEEEIEEKPYVPVRGKLRFRLRWIWRSVAGRIVLGTVAFLVVGTAGVAAYMLHSFLLHDARFVIPASANIETAGNTRLTRAQMLSVFGEDVERDIFKVPLEQRKADLERLPWVQRATVMRLLPNRLRVSVVERTPVAFVRQGSAIGLVDGSGVLLDMPANAAGDPRYSFPVLTGISADDPLSMRAARMEIYGRFMRELDGSGEKVTETLSEVDVSNPEDVKAVIPTGSTDILVHFGDEDFLARYRAFQAHLAEWKQRYPKLTSADMRYDRQVVLDTGAGVTPVNTAASNSVDAVKAEVPAAGVASTVAASTVAPKPVAKAAAIPAARAASVRPRAGKTSAANAKMFAALAAARKQQVESSGQGRR